ncbi:MAG TPA: glycosyltransferase family 1 protein [Methylomusa anaerophila]|uniref:D-inositol 3-phosphate glycosyltransferase n=1 Tax=Methylomusa anaerophila TaxID=1930071 RepID=A0A348AKN1_9FIRM|nr:glycosyltransferase family 1 protein [Methylomusa anaerophila]BBB91629.1 D-inositol 3-phosphate glycosyltransferase [Methylomusa anaerophila]HML89433.1 glycosyltransferase family 1 protein [Methylomusa anaerophila]
MRIGVDATVLSYGKTGVGHYVENVLAQLAKIDAANEYVLYSNRPIGWQADNSRFQYSIADVRYNNWWMQWTLPGLLKKDKIDLFWGVGFRIPFERSGHCLRVVTVHDLVYRIMPGTLPWKQALHLRTLMPLYLSCADHVIVNSRHTCNDLLTYYNYPAEKITVTPLAADHSSAPPRLPAQTQAVMAKYGIQPGYVLYVGTIEPRKGLDTLFRALSLFRESGSELPCLVLAGNIGWKSKPIIDLVERLQIRRQVTFLRYVPDDDLAALYRGAKIFVYPSLYEGFGLPVLEAMTAGVPVITTNSSSLPEVGGEGALYINPGDHVQLYSFLQELLGNEALRQKYQAKGRQQIKKFSWENTAAKTLDVFHKVFRQR